MLNVIGGQCWLCFSVVKGQGTKLTSYWYCEVTLVLCGHIVASDVVVLLCDVVGCFKGQLEPQGGLVYRGNAGGIFVRTLGTNLTFKFCQQALAIIVHY